MQVKITKKKMAIDGQKCPNLSIYVIRMGFENPCERFLFLKNLFLKIENASLNFALMFLGTLTFFICLFPVVWQRKIHYSRSIGKKHILKI